MRVSLLRSVQLQVLLSSGDSEQTAAVAMAATQRYRQSVDVWCLALQTMVHLGSGATGKLFQDALTHVNPKVHTHPHTHTVTKGCCESGAAPTLSQIISYSILTSSNDCYSLLETSSNMTGRAQFNQTHSAVFTW